MFPNDLLNNLKFKLQMTNNTNHFVKLNKKILEIKEAFKNI